MGGLAEWTAAEDRILRDTVAKSEARTMEERIVELLPLLPGRSRNSIRNRMSFLGVKRSYCVLDNEQKLIRRDRSFQDALRRVHPELAK